MYTRRTIPAGPRGVSGMELKVNMGSDGSVHGDQPMRFLPRTRYLY